MWNVLFFVVYKFGMIKVNKFVILLGCLGLRIECVEIIMEIVIK